MQQPADLVKRVGRPRDSAIEERVLTIAGQHLAEQGFEAMSVAAIAREADTTRQAIYRRWASKADLAFAVVATFAADVPEAPLSHAPSPFVDPYGDLVSELTDFAWGVSGPGRLLLVGTMLQDTTDTSVREGYRARVVAPRRRRLRSILEQAQKLELIDAGADLEIAVTLGTGSWYARALAGDPVPQDWAARTAALVWRAVGGNLDPHTQQHLATQPQPPPTIPAPPSDPLPTAAGRLRA